MSGEWPRLYTATELKTIAKSIGHTRLAEDVAERLQVAVEAYQWGSLWDDRIFLSSTNKGRRMQFNRIVELCKNGATNAEIEEAWRELDGFAIRLLGPVDKTDHEKLRAAAECAARKTPKRGPDARRARRQFVGKLVGIYELLSKKRASRIVDCGEYGPFLEFVRVALTPFKAAIGCEADIKIALSERDNKRRCRDISAT
jgi:hypothetical protein